MIQDDGHHDSRDPALALLADGSVMMSSFAHDGDIVSSYVRRSRDHGLSWDAPVAVAHPFETGSAVCAPVVGLGEGILLSPLFGRFVGEADTSSVVVRSCDHGATWTTLLPVIEGNGRPPCIVLPEGGVLAAEPMSTYAQMVAASDGSVAMVYALEQDRYHSAVRFNRLRWRASPVAMVIEDDDVVVVTGFAAGPW